MTFSNEIKAIIQSLSIPDQTKLAKEIGELIWKNGLPEEIATELVYRKYYGDQYKDLLKKEISTETIRETEKIDPNINSKLDKILAKIDKTEENIQVLLKQKANYYVNQGFKEEEAWTMAKAELLFDVPDTSKYDKNMESVKKESTSDSASIDDAATFLSQL